MVYVFGWNIPIFDFMFLLLAILTASVILVWIELSRLRHMIQDEGVLNKRSEVDLTRLETDLAKLENTGKKKKDLHEFIKDSLAKGATESDVQKLLLTRGWSKKHVTDAFTKINK